MSDCFLFLYWPDFVVAGSPRPAALVAHSLRRHLCTLHEELVSHVWVADPDAAAEFSKWGMRPVGEPFTPELVAGLVRRHPEPVSVVLAMSPERAAPVARALEIHGVAAEIWTPGSSNSGARPLEEVLRLRTAHTVGLFVDGSALGSLGPVEALGGPEVLQGRLLEFAALVGSVLTAPWYESEERFQDVAGQTPRFLDEPTLGEHLARRLEHGEALDTWILVTHASWAEELTRLAHQAGIRVLLWAPDESRLPPSAVLAADGVVSLAEILGVDRDLRSASRLRGGAVHADVRIASHTVPRAGSPEPGAERSRSALPTQPAGDSARLGPWVRLMYYVECAQRTVGSARLPFRKLAASLAEVDEFGPTTANATLWLNRAKSEGLLEIEQETNRLNPAIRVALCRAHAEHPVCRAAVEVPDRCLRLLFQMLQKIPWVSFKLLRSVLMREQWLGGPPYRLDETTIDEWLNFLIHDGAIRMTKEPNLVNPEYPVTALRLNEEHPLSRFVASEATESTRLGAERAILAVDHFLTRNRKPWMAMGALRRALEGMSREELQSVLQGLQNLGALITESYPNPQKEHFTTGCRLKLDEPVVVRALRIRNTIIQATQRHGYDRSWVPLATIVESLEEHAEGTSMPQRLAWFMLLRDEGILELDQEVVLPGRAWEEVRCRLNITDAVVRSVIADRSEMSTSYELD